LEKIWSGLETEDEKNMMEAALMNMNFLEALGNTNINTKRAQVAGKK
jgi:hypothetical protein